jgi:hypothetical protein
MGPLLAIVMTTVVFVPDDESKDAAWWLLRSTSPRQGRLGYGLSEQSQMGLLLASKGVCCTGEELSAVTAAGAGKPRLRR